MRIRKNIAHFVHGKSKIPWTLYALSKNYIQILQEICLKLLPMREKYGKQNFLPDLLVSRLGAIIVSQFISEKAGLNVRTRHDQV